MKKLIKYAKLFFAFKDIQKAWKEEKGIDRPKALSRGVIGAFSVFVGVALATILGVQLDPETINQIKDSLEKLAEGLWALKPVIATLYGILMLIAKATKEAKKKAEQKQGV